MSKLKAFITAVAPFALAACSGKTREMVPPETAGCVRTDDQSFEIRTNNGNSPAKALFIANNLRYDVVAKALTGPAIDTEYPDQTTKPRFIALPIHRTCIVEDGISRKVFDLK